MPEIVITRRDECVNVEYRGLESYPTDLESGWMLEKDREIGKLLGTSTVKVMLKVTKNVPYEQATAVMRELMNASKKHLEKLYPSDEMTELEKEVVRVQTEHANNLMLLACYKFTPDAEKVKQLLEGPLPEFERGKYKGKLAEKYGCLVVQKCCDNCNYPSYVITNTNLEQVIMSFDYTPDNVDWWRSVENVKRTAVWLMKIGVEEMRTDRFGRMTVDNLIIDRAKMITAGINDENWQSVLNALEEK